MREEIKAILDYVNKYRYNKELVVEDVLTIEEAYELIDYITNLQEENKRLSLELSGYRKAILNDDNLMGLKSRIDNAIEYIRSQYTITDDDLYLALYSSDGTLDKLESILKGEDKDV